MTETFRWRVTSESSATHTFAVRTVKLGDGYEQKWQVRLVGRKAVIEQVKAFLDARRGVEAFYWQPDGHQRLLVKAVEYRETPRGGKAYELSAEFEEVLA